VIKEISRSLSARLLGIFILTALVYAFVGRFVYLLVLDQDYLREVIGAHISLHADYVLSDIGSPPNIERAKAVAVQLDCGAVNVNDVISNLLCTTAPMGGWKRSGLGARFGGAEGLRKYCRQETVVAPRTNVGAGGRDGG